MKKRRFLISPYIFMLCVIAGGLIALCGVYVFHNVATGFIVVSHENPVPLWTCIEGWLVILFLAILFLSFYGFLFGQGYGSFGTMHITNEGLVFKAPFKRTVKMPYKEISFLGIDYGVLSLTKQFWIYFSREPIPLKYRRRINRMKMNSNTMRIQYRKELFDALVLQLPRDLSKRMDKCYSTIRLHRVEQEL